MNPNTANPTTGVQGAPTYTAPTAITSANTAPQAPIQLPAAPKDTTNYSGIVASGNAILDSLNKLKTEQAAAPANDYQSLLDQISKMSAPPAAATPPSLTDIYNNAYSSSGITGYQNDVNAKAQATQAAQSKLDALNAQLAGINAKAQAIPIQDQQNAEGRGITAAGLAPITAGQLRENALSAIPVQAQAIAAQAEVASAQGNQKLSESLLTQAQTHLDQVFQIQSQDAQNQYKAQTDQINAVYNFASKQEQAKLDVLKTQAQNTLTQQQDAVKNAQDLAKTAIANGQGDLAGKIAALDPKSPTFQNDLSNLEGQITVKQDTWSAPYMLGGNYVQKNDKTGEIRTAVNPDKPTTPTPASTQGSDLQDAITYMQAHPEADPQKLRQTFLAHHPTAAAAWDNFFTDASGAVTYPKPAAPAKSGLFGLGFLGL